MRSRPRGSSAGVSIEDGLVDVSDVLADGGGGLVVIGHGGSFRAGGLVGDCVVVRSASGMPRHVGQTAPERDFGDVRSRSRACRTGSRQGAAPTAQSTSSTAPHPVQTRWWWLSATRSSKSTGSACRLDAAHEARIGEVAERVVDRLQARARHGLRDHRVEEVFRAGVRPLAEGVEHCASADR